MLIFMGEAPSRVSPSRQHVRRETSHILPAWRLKETRPGGTKRAPEAMKMARRPNVLWICTDQQR
ncbi:MAG: hypothetical protein ACQER1_04030, partial [Armatimonadota bacterium]